MAKVIIQRRGKMDRWIDSLLSSLPLPDECIEWTGVVSDQGYGIYRRHHKAHRYILELATGPPPVPTHHAAHSCHNRACVNPYHLRWTDQSGNECDKRKAGRINTQKLTPEDVAAIRLDSRASHLVAKGYPVSAGQVRMIRCGSSWA